MIFDAEADLAPGAVLPWEQLGVPVALIALDAQLQPLFIDHASVVRRGGYGRDPRLVVGNTLTTAQWRRAPLWQARIEQMAEQIADAGDPPPPATALAQSFARLPPAGLLPTNALDLKVLPLNAATEKLSSDFFPGTFELDAVPVPIDGLDLAVREAASLAPIDMVVPDRVRVLVPVPQAVYEPRLLYEEVIDPEFQATLDRVLLARAGALGARQGLRSKPRASPRGARRRAAAAIAGCWRRACISTSSTARRQQFRSRPVRICMRGLISILTIRRVC